MRTCRGSGLVRDVDTKNIATARELLLHAAAARISRCRGGGREERIAAVQCKCCAAREKGGGLVPTPLALPPDNSRTSLEQPQGAAYCRASPQCGRNVRSLPSSAGRRQSQASRRPGPDAFVAIFFSYCSFLFSSLPFFGIRHLLRFHLRWRLTGEAGELGRLCLLGGFTEFPRPPANFV